MTRTKYFDDPKYDAAFDRCVDVMSRLLLKYGPELIDKQYRVLIETEHGDYTIILLGPKKVAEKSCLIS